WGAYWLRAAALGRRACSPCRSRNADAAEAADEVWGESRRGDHRHQAGDGGEGDDAHGRAVPFRWFPFPEPARGCLPQLKIQRQPIAGNVASPENVP
ncbi:hypothetical protein THAOC_09910, partial [Thalassiosira oceanica]